MPVFYVTEQEVMAMQFDTLPSKDGEVEVCYLDDDDKPLWYPATVTRLITYDVNDAVLGAACLQFKSAHGHGPHE